MRKILACILAMVLLASAVPMAITPVAAYEEKIPCDDGDNELTKEELVNAILPYMLDKGEYTLDDIGDAAWVYAYWDGEPKTVTDIFGEDLTIYRPIERLVNVGYGGPVITRALGARDIIIATNGHQANEPTFYPVLSKLPGLGDCNDPGTCPYEEIHSLKPDAFQTNLEAAFALPGGLEKKRIFEEKLPGIPIICLNMREPETLAENVEKYGYILDREDEAEEFIDWFEGYRDTLNARTEELSEDEKPRVYFESQHKYKCAASGSRLGQAITIAGGKNIVDEIIGPDDPGYGSITNEVDGEWVALQNPEFIFKRAIYGGHYGGLQCSYETDDDSEIATWQQEILDRDELARTDAVNHTNVYIIDDKLVSRPGLNIIGPAYMAKALHPDLFLDIDPQAMHQEFIDKFGYIDFNVYEHGVFVYPPSEEWW